MINSTGKEYANDKGGTANGLHSAQRRKMGIGSCLPRRQSFWSCGIIRVPLELDGRVLLVTA